MKTLNETKHTPKCECGSKHCDGAMQLNGVRFVCEGQSSLEENSSRWPVYEAAPALLEACKVTLEAIKAYENGLRTIPPHGDALRVAIAKAEAAQ